MLYLTTNMEASLLHQGSEKKRQSRHATGNLRDKIIIKNYSLCKLETMHTKSIAYDIEFSVRTVFVTADGKLAIAIYAS